jgi:type II secretory pathway pseudopilin PulG
MDKLNARTILIVGLLLIIASPARADDDPHVEVRLPVRTLEVGEAIDFQFVCVNTGRPETPRAEMPEGLELRRVNANPSYASSRTSIMGRTSQSERYTYMMRLLAVKEGTYTFGPITVTAGGKEYESEPITIEVRAATASEYVFVDVSVSRSEVYIGEKYTATLRIGIRQVISQGRPVRLNLFRDVLDQRGSEFSIFRGGDGQISTVWRPDSEGQRHRFEVLTIVKEMRAEELGITSIGPVFVKADYPTSLRRDFFGDLRVGNSRKETAHAAGVPVQVKAPPAADRPADFTGAIGRYRLIAEAAPTQVEQGQAITLTLNLIGKPLEGVAGPDLSENAELASRFDFSKDELVGDLERDRKVFRRAIFPKQAGAQTIPPITWSYFDTERQRYRTIETKPIEIMVEAASPGSVEIAGSNGSAGQPGGPPQETKLVRLEQGLSPNYANVNELLAANTFRVTPVTVTLLVGSPTAWLAITLVQWRRRRHAANPALSRRARAHRAAQKSLDAALRQSDAAGQLAALHEAVIQYLADRFNLAPGQCTPTEMRSHLTQAGIAPDTINELSDFLEEAAAARYAPTSAASVPPVEMRGRIDGWLREIERSAS